MEDHARQRGYVREPARGSRLAPERRVSLESIEGNLHESRYWVTGLFSCQI